MLGEFFDPSAEVLISEHCRPHWSQAGTVVFITFRMADSFPQEVAERWEREKQEWMRVRGHPTSQSWAVTLPTLAEHEQALFRKTFNRHREIALDECHGRCLLRRPELSRIVADSLLHFDRQRYLMGDFVVMPNHVHLLAVFPTAEAMRKQCASWLHFTAVRVNRAIGEKGKLWQEEPFDHLVRNAHQYEHLRRYIADNPIKAKLRSGEYRHYRSPT